MTETPPGVVPGTPVREEQIRSREVLTTADRAGIAYRWDLGAAMTGYLDGLKRGVILGRRCPTCQRVLLPPRSFCEQCFTPTVRWVELSDHGTIATFAICNIAWDARRISTPQLPAVIQIDGADGMGLLHLIGEVAPDRVHVGQRVRAVWKTEAERIGAITDIAYFAPVDHQEE